MYSGHNQGAYRIQSFFTRGHIPVVMALVVAAVAHFVFDFFSQGRLGPWVGCSLPTLHAEDGPARYWTLITYPIAQGGAGPWGVINTFFLCYWLWWVGGSLERSWGSASFARFFGTLTLVTALALWAGAKFLKIVYYPLFGLTLPVVGVTTAWAAINPYEELLFWMVIRMRAWVLAVVIVVIMLFIDFGDSPFLGLFALVNPLLGYLWVRGRMPRILTEGFGQQPRRGPDLRFYDADRSPRRSAPLDDLRGRSKRGPLGAFRDWQQRRRLEKLFRDSNFKDIDERKRNR